MKKIIFLMLFATLGWQQALAQSFTYGGLKYDITSATTVSVGFQNGTGTGAVTIPEQVTVGSSIYSVTSIGNYAFYLCSGLTSVTIPNSVTSFGNAGFYGCYSLTSITIPTSLTSIGKSVFFNCSSLTSITIPNSVISIGNYAFCRCSGLTSVSIPNSVTSIGSNVFSNCSGLTSVIIPNSVASIGQQAFQGCYALTTVTCDIATPLSIDAVFFGGVNQGACSLIVPAASVALYQAAPVWQNFASIICSNPTVNTTTISACNTYMWSNNGQTYTTSGVYTGTTTNCVTQKLNLTITPQTSFTSGGINYVVTSPTTVAVSDNPSASGVIVIPTSVSIACGSYSVTSIGDAAFFFCSGLTSVTIPNSVTSIGNNAFRNSGLTSVTIPNSVTSISAFAFSGCIGLTSVTIPNSLTSISEKTFYGCSGLTSVTIPNSVTSIGNYAFYECISLTSVTIPNSVTVIGSNTFYGCSSLTSVTIPNSVTNMGYGAFYNCSSLTSVTIPNSITSISDATFYGCSGLTSVTIPNSVTSIGALAFYNCSSLTSISIPNSVINIDAAAFFGCSGLTSITIPNSVTSIGNTAFAFCSGLTTVSIPNSVTNIGTSAFSTCSGLTSVICDLATPLSINANVFAGVNQGACSLTVPAVSGAAYQAAPVWKNFMVLLNIPNTKIKANQCGITLTSLTDNINADYVAGYQQYRFEVSNGTTVNTVVVNKYNFSLTQTSSITYGTTYSVRVAVKMGDTWGTYGASCNITTPTLVTNTVPTTTILPSLCGTTLASKDSKITAVMLAGATKGRFEITKAGSAPVVYEVASTVIKLSQTGVVVDYNTTYSIRVAAFVGGVWGNYGASCTVTTPAPPRLKAKTFEVSAYPNPFETAFNLNLDTPSKEEVTIAVYDMMGKLVETHQVNPMEVANLQIGNNFAAGIYNVIVSQANEMKAIRLIRK